MGQAKPVQDGFENAEPTIRQDLSGNLLYPLLLGFERVESSLFTIEDRTQTHHMNNLMGEDIDEKVVKVFAQVFALCRTQNARVVELDAVKIEGVERLRAYLVNVLHSRQYRIRQRFPLAVLTREQVVTELLP